MAAPRMLIAGNWKMNMLAAEGVTLARGIDERVRAGMPDCDVLVCPPATILRLVSDALAGGPVKTGGQDCHNEASGAFTGDVSAAMLADAGASYVILGHSERRHGLGETDEYIRAKLIAAHGAGLRAIVCVGETEAERDGGQTLAVLSTQLDGSLPIDPAGKREHPVGGDNLVIAYEPVWAIGTGRTPSLDEVAEAHGHIRTYLRAALGDAADAIALLYGGSMKADNARDILAVANVNGGLIGGASLDQASFWAIIEAGSAAARR